MNGELYDKIQGQTFFITNPDVDLAYLSLTTSQVSFLTHAGFFLPRGSVQNVRDPLKLDSDGYLLTSVVNTSSSIFTSTHVSAITVNQTTAAAIMASTAAPRGIKVWSPDGTGNSVANTDDIAIGYSGLTAANAVDWLTPGDSAVIPCSNVNQVYALSATAGQTLRLEIL